MNARDTYEIINDIKELVKAKGYIYALCMIILEDFHVNPSKLDEVDVYAKLNRNEAQMLIGFLVQNEFNFQIPESPFDLLKLKEDTYKLMKELHYSTMRPFFDKMRPNPENTGSMQSFFGAAGMFIEPIFYAGDGIYDFQYLEFLSKKYKYDEKWLNNVADFYFDKVKEIALLVRSLHHEKIKKIHILHLRDNKTAILEELKKDKSIPKFNRKKRIADILTGFEFYQFYELFETEVNQAKDLSFEEIGERGWESFYKNLIDLFTVKKSDFPYELNINSFLEKFSIPLDLLNRNSQFNSIGDFNLFAVRPIIQIDQDRFFVPLSFSLFEAVYESPYYWMQADKSYSSSLSETRGKASEEIVHDLLKEVFGDLVYKSVKIESKKGHSDTDIDVLCVLGSKALVVQVKSKKLTQLSRRGDSEQLKKDFKGAIQDAYSQGLLCRRKILERKSMFYNESGDRILVPEQVDEVYILVVTTENYPSLTHQSYTLLEKEDTDPHALILTVFDLELVAFYLTNPYDFMYYVRQRSNLMGYYHADEEMPYLGYHLLHKLRKIHDADYVTLTSDFGQLIDQNYFVFKNKIDLPSKDDKVKNRWRNIFFENICSQIARLNFPRKTDIIFSLFDWPGESLDNLMTQINIAKSKTLADGKTHNVTIVRPERFTFGITFISWGDNSIQGLADGLSRHCQARKYKSKAEIWIGIGCLKDSNRIIDFAVFNDEKWHHDELMEREVEILLGGENKGIPIIKPGRKVGRNEPCPCGSRLKYKKCCG